MNKEYKNTDVIYCPHCKCGLEGSAEDNTIPGRTGDESRSDDQCWECDKPFTAYRKDKDTICVSTTEDYEYEREENSPV